MNKVTRNFILIIIIALVLSVSTLEEKGINDIGLERKEACKVYC